jgi:S-formylglutathione hydrolase FrmB
VKRWFCAAILFAAALAPAAHAAELVDIPVPARNGEISDAWLPRYPEGGPPRAKVLLPDGYDPAKAYPLLVLLPGLNNHYTWSSDADKHDIVNTAKGFEGIIVMPEGSDGWYTDWWNDGRRWDPAWESYHLDQVIPQVLERYRIRPERRWHALAGTSMGGLGAAYLGGRLPGFFGSVAIFSGLVDTQMVPVENAIQSGISTTSAGAPLDPEAVYGPADGFYANGHNPVKLAANMADTRVFMTTGDGTYDGANAYDPAEGAVIRPASDSYAAALRAAGVDLTYEVHPGGHDWLNFRKELRDAIAWGLFEPVDEHPTSWVNDTVATHGKLWEFAYRFDSPPDRIVRFRRAGGQLTIGAAGSPVTITTDGGCVLHSGTPAKIEIPARPCATLALRVRPRSLTARRWTTVRAAVTPALAGALVRLGRARAVTDERGVARLRVCLRSPGRRRVRATVANRLPARAAVRVRRTVTPWRRSGSRRSSRPSEPRNRCSTPAAAARG